MFLRSISLTIFAVVIICLLFFILRKNPPVTEPVSRENSSHIEKEDIKVFENVTHHYSSVNAFNSDESRALVSKREGFLQIRDRKGVVVKDDLNRFGIFPKGDPLWSKNYPDILFFHTPEGNSIQSFNIETEEMRTIHTFTEFNEISFGNGEGDIAKTFIPVIGDKRYGLIFDIENGRVSKSTDLYEYSKDSPIDVFDIFQSGTYAVAWGSEGGAHVFDQEMNFIKTILDYGGHSDRGIDTKGRDVLIITNSNDPTPLSHCENGIVKVSIPEGEEACLIELDWGLTPHISCNANISWCVISTYGDVEKTILFENEIFLLSVKGGKTISLGKSGASEYSYEKTPRATISGNGNFVIFDSDMGGDDVNVILKEIGGLW